MAQGTAVPNYLLTHYLRIRVLLFLVQSDNLIKQMIKANNAECHIFQTLDSLINNIYSVQRKDGILIGRQKGKKSVNISLTKFKMCFNSQSYHHSNDCRKEMKFSIVFLSPKFFFGTKIWEQKQNNVKCCLLVHFTVSH